MPLRKDRKVIWLLSSAWRAPKSSIPPAYRSDCWYVMIDPLRKYSKKYPKRIRWLNLIMISSKKQIIAKKAYSFQKVLVIAFERERCFDFDICLYQFLCKQRERKRERERVCLIQADTFYSIFIHVFYVEHRKYANPWPALMSHLFLDENLLLFNFEITVNSRFF